MRRQSLDHIKTLASNGLGGLSHQRLTASFLPSSLRDFDAPVEDSDFKDCTREFATHRSAEVVVLADKLGNAWMDMSRGTNVAAKCNFFRRKCFCRSSQRFLQHERSFVIYLGRACRVPSRSNFWHASLHLHACRGLGAVWPGECMAWALCREIRSQCKSRSPDCRDVVNDRV